jgi:hypothetical protein
MTPWMTIWTLVKRYAIPVIVVIALAVLCWKLYEKNESYVKTLDAMQRAHAEEIDSLKKAKEAQDP